MEKMTATEIYNVSINEAFKAANEITDFYQRATAFSGIAEALAPRLAGNDMLHREASDALPAMKQDDDDFGKAEIARKPEETHKKLNFVNPVKAIPLKQEPREIAHEEKEEAPKKQEPQEVDTSRFTSWDMPGAMEYYKPQLEELDEIFMKFADGDKKQAKAFMDECESAFSKGIYKHFSDAAPNNVVAFLCYVKALVAENAGEEKAAC